MEVRSFNGAAVVRLRKFQPLSISKRQRGFNGAAVVRSRGTLQWGRSRTTAEMTMRSPVSRALLQWGRSRTTAEINGAAVQWGRSRTTAEMIPGTKWGRVQPANAEERASMGPQSYDCGNSLRSTGHYFEARTLASMGPQSYDCGNGPGPSAKTPMERIVGNSSFNGAAVVRLRK